MITTQEGTYGGMMKRFNPNQKITDYFGVPSVIESSAKVEKLSGKILVPKMAVSNMGYFALCMDTENNIFGLWEDDPQAK
jgi:predicted enzyme related to lactoylglutathione lyase